MDLYDQATQDACSPAVLCPLLNQTLLFFFFTFIYFLLCWVFIAVRRLSPVAASGAYSLIAVCRLLVAVASLVAERRL